MQLYRRFDDPAGAWSPQLIAAPRGYVLEREPSDCRNLAVMCFLLTQVVMFQGFPVSNGVTTISHQHP